MYETAKATQYGLHQPGSNQLGIIPGNGECTYVDTLYFLSQVIISLQ